MMDTTVFNILSRKRENSVDLATVKHFTCDEGQTVPADILLKEVNWTPYSLDDEQKLVYFVQCPAAVDLSQSPFMYSLQFEQAQRLLSMPYSSLIDLIPAMKRPQKLICIYSTGRCGSTLLSQILNLIEGVYSLSEPDIFTILGFLYQTNPSKRAELSAITEACGLLHYPQGETETRTSLVLKFRSQVLTSSELLQDAFPDAYNIFMYRNALTWAQSLYKFWTRLGFKVDEAANYEQLIQVWAIISGGANPSYIQPYLDGESFYASHVLAPAWTFYLDQYDVSFERGLRFHCLRYEELNQVREKTLKALFNYCGFPGSELEKTMLAYETDSQDGTEIARDINVEGMPDRLKEHFLSILALHPKFNHPDIMVGAQ